jgi:4-hydroxy-3-methylbut-2-enyl diphosphate reductase
MKILRSEHYGMCFGVRDAIALAGQQAAAGPLTILGDLVHNESVLTRLQSQGVQMEREVARISTPTVMITAHGTSQRTLHRMREHGLQVIEATCPLVHWAHRAVATLVRDGYHPVIIGRRDHVEVRGVTEDLDEHDVILEDEDVEHLPERPRFGVVAQTTQPIDKVRRLVTLLGDKFPRSEIRYIDTVCQPTKQRQTAAIQLAQQCDVVVVIGGAQSNNTKELVATCLDYCPRVYHIQSAHDLRSYWFTGAETIGLTAGTSTPDESIDEVEEWLKEFADFQERLEKVLTLTQEEAPCAS